LAQGEVTMFKTLTKTVGILGFLAALLMVAGPVTAGYNPTGAKTTSSVSEFQHVSPFSYSYVFDKPSGKYVTQQRPASRNPTQPQPSCSALR